MVDVPSSIAKFVCWVNIRMRLFSLSLELIYGMLLLTYWYMVSGTSLANVHFNAYLVKTVFHELSVIRVSFLMEIDFLHRFQPYRYSIRKKEGRHSRALTPALSNIFSN